MMSLPMVLTRSAGPDAGEKLGIGSVIGAVM